MVFSACTMSKFFLHVVIYFSLIVIAVAKPHANVLNQFCDILSMYKSEPRLEHLYEEPLLKQAANVVVDAFKQCADLQRTSPNSEKIVYVLMCQEIETLGEEKCKRNPKFDITYWPQANDEPCSIYHQALQSIPNENFIELKEPPEGKTVPSVVLNYLKNPSFNPYTGRSDCSTLCGQSAVDPICDLAALLYVTPVQETIPEASDGVSPVVEKASEQMDKSGTRPAPAGQEDSNKDAQTVAREDATPQDKSSALGIQENTLKKEVVPNMSQTNVTNHSKQSQSIPGPENPRPLSDKSHPLNSTENLLITGNKIANASLKSNGSANPLVRQISPADNNAPELSKIAPANVTANSAKIPPNNSTAKLKAENKTEPSKSDPTNPKVKDPASDLTPNIKDTPGAESKPDATLPGKDDKTDATPPGKDDKTDAAPSGKGDKTDAALPGKDDKKDGDLPGKDDKTDETTLKSSEDKPQQNEDNSKPAVTEDDANKPANNPGPAVTDQKVTEKNEVPLETNKNNNNNNEGNAEVPKADPEQVDEAEPSKETKPKPAESENAIPKPDFNNDDEGAGQDLEKTVGNEERFPPVDGDKENMQSSDRDRQPEDLPDRKSSPNSVFPEQEDSHFFAYFLTVIIIIILAYLVVHNKQKILGLIVEGRGTQRRRSHSYRKLDSDATKGSQMIF